MNTELDILKRNRNEINKNCCLLEFEVKGFKDRLDGLRVPYKVYFRNPLHKNRFVVGIPRFEFDEIVSNEGLVVIGMVDTKKCMIISIMFLMVGKMLVFLVVLMVLLSMLMFVLGLRAMMVLLKPFICLLWRIFDGC